MKTFPIGGVHPSENKLSRGSAVEPLPLPDLVAKSEELGDLLKEVHEALNFGLLLLVPLGDMLERRRLVLSLMASAMVASAVSRLVSRPLYTVLADLQLKRLPQQPAQPF